MHKEFPEDYFAMLMSYFQWVVEGRSQRVRETLVHEALWTVTSPKRNNVLGQVVEE